MLVIKSLLGGCARPIDLGAGEAICILQQKNVMQFFRYGVILDPFVLLRIKQQKNVIL